MRLSVVEPPWRVPAAATSKSGPDNRNRLPDQSRRASDAARLSGLPLGDRPGCGGVDGRRADAGRFPPQGRRCLGDGRRQHHGPAPALQLFRSLLFRALSPTQIRLPQFGGRRPHDPQHAGPIRLRHRRLEADRRLRRAGDERSRRNADREIRGQHGRARRADPRDQRPPGDLLGQPDEQRQHAEPARPQPAPARICRRLENIHGQREAPLCRPVPCPARYLGQQQTEGAVGQFAARPARIGRGRFAPRRGAPEGVPGGPGNEPHQAGVDAGRRGPSRPARPADDGHRPFEAARRRRLCQQRHARRPRHAPRGQGMRGRQDRGRGGQDRLRSARPAIAAARARRGPRGCAVLPRDSRTQPVHAPRDRPRQGRHTR